jgi:hypothetical protein
MWPCATQERRHFAHHLFANRRAEAPNRVALVDLDGWACRAGEDPEKGPLRPTVPGAADDGRRPGARSPCHSSSTGRGVRTRASVVHPGNHEPRRLIHLSGLLHPRERPQLDGRVHRVLLTLGSGQGSRTSSLLRSGQRGTAEEGARPRRLRRSTRRSCSIPNLCELSHFDTVAWSALSVAECQILLAKRPNECLGGV